MTDAEIERLGKLIEECGEVIQIAGKILQHGYESKHIDYGNIPNRQLLQKELKDVMKILNLMYDRKDIEYKEVISIQLPDMKYFHYQG